MATVTELAKEALLGVEQSKDVTEQNREEFLKHALKDEETGDYYMTENEFIEAIAPAGEDYVELAHVRASKPYLLTTFDPSSTR